MNTTSSYTERIVPAVVATVRREIVQRTYESGGRVYIVDEREFPSVTTILRRVLGNPFTEEAEMYLDHARARGNEVHRSIEMLSKGIDLDWSTVHHEVKPRLHCFEHWRDEYRWHPELVETAVVSLRYGFAGTPDQLGCFDTDDTGRAFVVDFKPPKAWFIRLQLSFYAIAAKEALQLERLPARMPVYLSDDKPARCPTLDRAARDRDRALSVLNVWNIGIEEGVWE